MISLIVILEVQPARVAEFETHLKEQATASLREPGCRRFEVSRKLDQANVFTLAELYDDQAALEAHLTTPHFYHWREVTTELIINKTAVRGEVFA